MLESEFYESIRKGSGLAWERIENTCLPGQPDTVCKGAKGQSVECEFKVCKGYTLDLETFQIAWFTRAMTNGSKSKIIAEKNGIMLIWSCKQLPVLLSNGIIKVRGKRNHSTVSLAHRIAIFNQSPIFKSAHPYDWEGFRRCVFG